MEASLIGFAALLLLAFLGLPLGFALISVGVIGFAFERGLTPALAMSGQQILDISTNFGLSVLPLFMLMGAFIHRAGLAEDLYDAANAWLGHRRGGLAMATVAACAGFGAVSGSSLATAATMAKVAMPPMRRYGYADSLAAGSIASGGTLGILIPPSVPLVIYGILAEVDIGQLFIAGILPGILLATLYILGIALVTRINPALGPAGPAVERTQKWRALARVWGVLLLFVVVLGGIYFGVFTPTEAAGIGATGAFLFALLRRRLDWHGFIGALVDAGKMTGMIFVVAFGALIFANFVNLAGLPGALVDAVTALDVSPLVVVLLICLIYIVLGTVFESLGMLLLTVPVFIPVVQPLGIDLVWFGIVVIIVMEIGLITPPIGMNVFIVKSALPDVELWAIFKGIGPFVAAGIVCLFLILFVPDIALMLPKFMR